MYLVSRTVDAAGATIRSTDGLLVVTVPAGALTSPTTIVIDEITNTAPGGVGTAYRLEPSGVEFALPVELRFTVLDGTDLALLTAGWQEDQGFWLRERVVARDAAARTLTTTVTHLSDWAVLRNNSARDLRGPLRIESTLGVRFAASGQAALDFALEDAGASSSYYVMWGSLTAADPIPDGTATCHPQTPAVALQANVAELQASPTAFLWGVDGYWDLTCRPTSGPDYGKAAMVVFDTAGISRPGCTRRYVGTPILGADRLAGTVVMDCGAEGTVTAAFDLVTCTPGVPCASPNGVCRVAETSCDTGVAVCVDVRNVDDGTSCGTDLVCAAGACVCDPGPSPTCPAADACHTAEIVCATGSPVCTQTAVADGTSCGTDLVCTAGACACNPGPSPTCQPVNACNTAAIDCATGSPVCTQTPVSDGTSCGTDLVCTAGACACNPGPSPTCPAANACHTAAIDCATGSPVCTQTPVADGTSCGTDLVCTAGACACNPGPSPTCQPVNVCHTAAIGCATGSPVCVQTPVADGTSCGTDLVCSGGSCACSPGPSPTCQPVNVCNTAAIDCATGSPVCAQTPVPDGTSCGTDLACSGGSCACNPGPSPTCQPVNACNTAAIGCATGSPVCVQTPVADGTSCGTDLACSGGSCACKPGASPTCQPVNACNTAAIDCASGSPVCAQTPVPDGTSCGADLVCSAGACVCDAGGSCAAQDACHVGRIACDAAGTPSCTQVELADGTTCGAGQTCNAGTCLPSRTVSGTRLVRHWTDAGAPTSAVAPDAVFPATAAVEALVADGAGWRRYAGAFAADGSYAIPSVPEGPYVLVLVDGAGVLHAWETSSSTVDLGYDVLGRAGAVTPTVATPVTLELSWPDAWNAAGDELQITASNADVVDAAVSGARLAAGATSTPVPPDAPLVEDWDRSGSGGALNLLAAGDAVYVHHLVTRTAPDHQAAASAGGPLTDVAIVDATGGTIAAVLAAPATSGTVTLDWHTTAFEALLPSMGPAATADASPHRLRLGASAHPLARPAPVATRSPTLLRMTRPAGSPDELAVGPLAFARFLDPALWNEWLEAEFVARASYLAPGATAPLAEEVTVHVRSAHTDAATATVVAPGVGPVTAPAIDGASALAPLSGVGATPLLSWTAPAGTAPASYVVTLYRLGLAADGVTSTRVPVAVVTTSSTQVRVPPNVLTTGRYFARIEARSDAPDPLAPLGVASVGSSAGALTADFGP